MMHERNYTLPFNLNGYESTATENLFSLSIGEQTGQEMARKNFAQYSHNRNEKNKEARNCVRERHIYQRKKEERKM